LLINYTKDTKQSRNSFQSPILCLIPLKLYIQKEEMFV